MAESTYHLNTGLQKSAKSDIKKEIFKLVKSSKIYRD